MSRTLDDIEELLLPGAIAIGGLYLLWWLSRFTDRSANYLMDGVPKAVDRIADYNVPIVGEGDLIDRWTLNPREIRYELGRLKNWTGRFL